MPTIVINFMLSSVEHEKKFYNLEAWLTVNIVDF